MLVSRAANPTKTVLRYDRYTGAPYVLSAFSRALASADVLAQLVKRFGAWDRVGRQAVGGGTIEVEI